MSYFLMWVFLFIILLALLLWETRSTKKKKYYEYPKENLKEQVHFLRKSSSLEEPNLRIIWSTHYFTGLDFNSWVSYGNVLRGMKFIGKQEHCNNLMDYACCPSWKFEAIEFA